MAKKTVKAWAVVDKKTQTIPTWMGHAFVYHTKKAALGDLEGAYETILPCTITYDLPKKRAKK